MCSIWEVREISNGKGKYVVEHMGLEFKENCYSEGFKGGNGDLLLGHGFAKGAIWYPVPGGHWVELTLIAVPV